MSNKEKSQTALTVQTSVPEALQAIDKKISEMKRIQESVYVTSGKITTAGGQKDIKIETDVYELVKAFSSIQMRAEGIVQAYNTLGITTHLVPKIDGGTVDEWKQDIQLRIDIIEQKETLDELNEIKKEWHELLDKEDRKAILVNKMKKFSS